MTFPFMYYSFTTFLPQLFLICLIVSLEMLREHHITYFRCPDMERKHQVYAILSLSSLFFPHRITPDSCSHDVFSFQRCSDHRVPPRDRRLRWSIRPNGPCTPPRTPSRNYVCFAWLGVLMAFLVWVGKFESIIYLYSVSECLIMSPFRNFSIAVNWYRVAGRYSLIHNPEPLQADCIICSFNMELIFVEFKSIREFFFKLITFRNKITRAILKYFNLF